MYTLTSYDQFYSYYNNEACLGLNADYTAHGVLRTHLFLGEIQRDGDLVAPQPRQVVVRRELALQFS